MLADVRGLTRGALDVLELLAVLCGIVLFGIAAFSLLLATIRVAIRGRVFALPFTGNDNRRVELANLFIRRLSTMEEEWIELAQEIEAVRTDINARAEAYDEVSAVAPLTSKGKLPPLQAPSEQFIAVTATRTTGDELLYQVVQLGGIDSIGSADLGVVSLAGVSFSPRDILALLRAAPGILARRTLRGSIITTVGGNLLTVEFEERGPIAGRRRRTETAEVKADAWRAAIEDLAYRIERERVYLVRDRPSWRRRFVAVQDDARSQTVRQGLIEAESWVACRSFLVAYAAHLKHYRDGSAAEREEALRSYDEALASQPRFPRAAYNRAVLLYNRFLPIANDQAIEGFELATTTRDPSLMPLALSGLAMAHCQAIQRFHRNRDDHQQAARSAANAAFALAPQLVEAAFAQGWIQQLDGKWHDAITQYRAVVTLPGGNRG